MAEVLRLYSEDGEEFLTDNSKDLVEAFKAGGTTFTLDDGRVLTAKMVDTEKMN